MSSYNSVPPGDPAFLANRKALGRSSSLRTGLTDCCYSFSNLIIIFACIIGLYFTVQFITDDPLYECGEHLLTLRFYRQLIFIIVVFPLIILIPLFNAVSACFSSSRSHGRRSSLGHSTLLAKILYQVLMALLAFIALIFVAPSIKYSSLVKQIDYEFKRHMKFMYDKDFSRQFLDDIQSVYECCDTAWYEVNYNYRIPPSCFEQGGDFTKPFMQTCPEAIGWIVSTRCSVIAACLVLIIIAIAILIALDVLELISLKEMYEVRKRSTRPKATMLGESETAAAASAAITTNNDDISSIRPVSPHNWDEHTSPTDRSRYQANDEDDSDDDDGGFRRRAEHHSSPLSTDQNRLRSDERRRDRPLLTTPNGGRTTPLAETEPDLADGLDLKCYDDARVTSPPPAILTKVNYISRPAGSRPKSPVFVGANGHSRSSSPRNPPSPAPPRGVLKKTSSFSRSLDRESLGGRGYSEEDVNAALAEQSEFEAYQRQLQQTLQSQRPMFNVRFAE